MFSNILSALQGGTPVDEDDDGGPQPGTSQQRQRAEERSGFSLLGVAEAVANNMKEAASDFITSVQDTDWKSELTVFGKTMHDETVELGVKTVRAVETLPEAGISLPDLGAGGMNVHDQLEGMGQSISRFGQGIMSTTRNVLQQAIDKIENEMDSAFKSGSGSTDEKNGSSARSSTAKYSRMDAEIKAMQRDSSTYCEEPEDEGDFRNWKATFDLVGQKHAINELTGSNAFMAELQSRIVPVIVEYDVFWTRYYYRLSKLEKKHKQQKELTERSTRLHEEEAQASWEDDYEVGDNDEEIQTLVVMEKDSLVERGPSTSQSKHDRKTSIEAEADLVWERTVPAETHSDAMNDVANRLGQVQMDEQFQDDDDDMPELPLSTSAGQRIIDSPRLVEPLATIPTMSESSSGRTSDGSPSERVKIGTESDTAEMASTSDGSGNREWCVVNTPTEPTASQTTSTPGTGQAPDRSQVKEGATEDSPDNDDDDDDDDDDVDEDWGNWD